MMNAEIIIGKLRQRGMTLATAESCTGGNIAHVITEIAGCSDIFRGGIVAYSNEVKRNVLGVESAALENHGAVSQAVVQQMAAGACSTCGTSCAVATSGIAGPGGAVPGKPVGTVWIAARTPSAATEKCFHFSGDRSAIISQATTAALSLLDEIL